MIHFGSERRKEKIIQAMKKRKERNGDFVETGKAFTLKASSYEMVLLVAEERENSDFMSEFHFLENARLSTTDVVDRWLIPPVGNGYVLRLDTSTLKDVFLNAR